MAQDVIEQLKERERKIRELQSTQSRLEGKRDQVVTTLKKDFAISTLEAGKELKEKNQEELDKIDSKIVGLVENLDVEIAKSRRS